MLTLKKTQMTKFLDNLSRKRRQKKAKTKQADSTTWWLGNVHFSRQVAEEMHFPWFVSGKSFFFAWFDLSKVLSYLKLRRASTKTNLTSVAILTFWRWQGWWCAGIAAVPVSPPPKPNQWRRDGELPASRASRRRTPFHIGRVFVNIVLMIMVAMRTGPISFGRSGWDDFSFSPPFWGLLWCRWYWGW